MMKRKRIRVNDISVSYLVENKTEQPEVTLVFLHGFPFNKNMWTDQLEALPDTAQGIALDIRGHGQSTRGHGFFSIDVFADDLLAVIDELQLKNVVVCGVSMGGYIALRAYEKRPKAFQGLVLVDTHPFADTDDQKKKRFDTIQSVLAHGRRVFSINFVDQVLGTATLKKNPQAVERIKSAIRRNK